MEVIESRLKGKLNQTSLCEDGFVITADFAAVVDGSTSKIAGRNGGRRAMEIICKAIPKLPTKCTKEEMLTRLTAALARENPPEAQTQAAYRLTCSAVIISRKHRCAWMIGDCQLRINSHTFTHPKLVDSILTETRCCIVRNLLQTGHSIEELQQNDLGRAFIMDALRDQTNFQNDPNPYNPYRYPVLDGTPIDPQLVPEIPLPLSATECILASDGYPTLLDSLAESEAELQRLLIADPLCINQLAATKAMTNGQCSFDDRCYLRIRL